MFVIKGKKYVIILINYQSKAICERKKTSAFYPKFVASSCTNVTLSVLKDKAYASMFGKGDPKPMSYKSMGKTHSHLFLLLYTTNFLCFLPSYI
jgi:hypothetical protein